MITSRPEEPAPRIEDGSYYIQHDWNGDTELSTALSLALERITGVDVVDREPLNQYVDPEALDKLFAPGAADCPRTRGELTFQYAGMTITIRATGDVVLSPISPAVVAGNGGTDD